MASGPSSTRSIFVGHNTGTELSKLAYYIYITIINTYTAVLSAWLNYYVRSKVENMPVTYKIYLFENT